MLTLRQRVIVNRDRERVRHGRMNEKQTKLVGATQSIGVDIFVGDGERIQVPRIFAKYSQSLQIEEDVYPV